MRQPKKKKDSAKKGGAREKMKSAMKSFIKSDNKSMSEIGASAYKKLMGGKDSVKGTKSKNKTASQMTNSDYYKKLGDAVGGKNKKKKKKN